MRVLITGAGGFIGRCVSRKMEEQGHRVIRVLRPGSNSETSAAGTVLRLDLSRPEIVPQVIDQKPDAVVHLAAVIPSTFAGADATQAAQVIRRIDENVFLACRDLGVRIVYASTSSVYGNGDGDVKSEESPTNPVGPYAAAKLEGEETGQHMLSDRGLPFTSLRINAPYGQGQGTRTVLSLFIEGALRSLPLRYHGTGSRQQDFTQVEDIADAISKACRLSNGGIFNLAGGSPITMRALAELVVKCVPGSTSKVEPSGENDPQEGATARYSIAKAKNLLGWQPQISLETGIKTWAVARI